MIFWHLKGVLEKVGVEAQVERIGKYKTFGDQFVCKSMSEENREMLTSLLDNIYSNWLDKISLARGAIGLLSIPFWSGLCYSVTDRYLYPIFLQVKRRKMLKILSMKECIMLRE